MEKKLGDKYDLKLALRNQIFEYLRETFFRRALGYLELAASKKKKKLPTEAPDHHLTFLKDCGRWGHVFAAGASPRP